MDTAFAKIVTDLNGRNHILIEGEMVSLYGPTERVNLIVEAIVRGLRNQVQRSGVACADHSAVQTMKGQSVGWSHETEMTLKAAERAERGVL